MNQSSNIHTLRPRADLYFHDSQSVVLPMTITALDAWNYMMAEPQPVLRLAFRIRDAISSWFGVKRIGGFSGRQRRTVQAGERLDFFLVEHAAPDVLVLTERDRHLDVMTCVSVSGPELTITSSVVTHNRFGRVYMCPVGPAHKLIVRNMLKKLKRKLGDAGPRIVG